jgi:hypothetical protein
MRLVFANNREHVQFDSLDGGTTGYFATDQPVIWAEFELHMRQGRSGVTEITAEEFVAEFVEPKKKGGIASRIGSREEIGPGARLINTAPKPAVAAVVSDPTPAPAPAAPSRPAGLMAGATVDEPPAPAPERAAFVPRVGRRGPKRT